jgi:death on curing protein
VSGPTGNRSLFRHKGLRFPTVKSVISLHDAIIADFGGLPGVKNPGLLESAVSKAVVTAGGDDAYPGLFTKTAAIGYSIAQNHVFNDANKRTALSVMVLILEINDVFVAPSEDASSTLMILIATGHLSIDGIRAALLHLAGENPADPKL